MPRHPVRMRALGIGTCGLLLAGCATAASAATATSPNSGASATVWSTAAVTGAAFPDPRAGWALGTAGGETRIWHTVTGGAAWQEQWQGRGTPLALTAADAAHAWALIACAGQGGSKPACGRELLGTADAGRHWRTLTTFPGSVNEVSFASPRQGVAVADSCLADLSLQRCPGQVLVSHNGGSTWTAVLTRATPVFAVSSVAGQLWAAETVPGGSQVRFLTSADGGQSWRRTGQLTGLPSLSPQARITMAVTRATARHLAALAWAAVYDRLSCAMHGCFGSLYGSSDDGRGWQIVNLSDAYPDECGPADIALSASSDGTAWLATGRNGAACPPPLGLLYRHGPGGWKQLTPWQLNTAGTLDAVTQDVAYAVTESGALSRTADGGQHWTQVLPPPSPVFTSQLAVTGVQTALATGDPSNAGAVLRSADGGLTWQQIADLPGIVTWLDVQQGSVTAVTYTPDGKTPRELWISADGGITWRPGGPLPGAGAGSGTIDGPWMTPDGHGLLLAVTDGTPWAPQNGGSAPVREWTTSDGGQTWTRGILLPLGGDSLNGSASFTYLGNGEWSGWLAVTTAKTFTAQVLSVTGTSVRPLPGTLPADGLQLTGSYTGFTWSIDYTKVQVLNLYRTTDGGRTWQRSRFTLPATADTTPLLGFSDASHGWLVLGSRTWHTSDGGQTWH
jgi:photosystem II stability/assembly factor-like uncharacterized protein